MAPDDIILVIAAAGAYVAWDAKRMSRQLEEKNKQIQQLEQSLDDMEKEKLESASANLSGRLKNWCQQIAAAKSGNESLDRYLP